MPQYPFLILIIEHRLKLPQLSCTCLVRKIVGINRDVMRLCLENTTRIDSFLVSAQAALMFARTASRLKADSNFTTHGEGRESFGETRAIKASRLYQLQHKQLYQ
jgi:hypothetical protein